MKIEEVFQKAKSESDLPKLRREVLQFFKRHQPEVFIGTDSRIYKELDKFKPSAIGWSIWALERDGFLAAYKVKNAPNKAMRRTFHGLPDNIKRLQEEDKKHKR